MNIIRLFDLFISAFLLIILIPLFVLVSLLSLFTHGKPIIYSSARVGLKGKTFNLFKFRTMRLKKNYSDKDQITIFGKFLRRSSIDETPQFLNVFIGHMSIVGPRPLPLEIENNISYQSKQLRRKIKPGITGLSQVTYSAKKRTLNDKVALDLEYINKMSIYLYLSIILRTFSVLFKRYKYNKQGKTL